MTKKRLLLIASLPLAIALTIGVLAMLPPRPDVTKASFDRIEKGMTLNEVESILQQKQSLESMSQGGTPEWRAARWRFRNGNGSSMEIMYMSHPNNGVWTEFTVSGMTWTEESNEVFLDSLRRWLRLD